MTTIKVWYEDVNGELSEKALRNLKPRRYMCGWNFTKLLKYIKEELLWREVKEDDVQCIVIENEKEHWYQIIKKEN